MRDLEKIFATYRVHPKIFSRVLAHMLAQMHAKSSLLHVQWFTSPAHPRASIDIIGMKFEAF